MKLRALSHGKAWTQENDTKLQWAWENTQKSIADLATEFDRSVSSISARMVKLLLVDNRNQARLLSRERQNKQLGVSV